MKTKELYEKDDKSLQKILTETNAKIVKDRFKIASKEMTQYSEVKKNRKIVARVNTILTQRAILKKEEPMAEKPISKKKTDNGEKK